MKTFAVILVCAALAGCTGGNNGKENVPMKENATNRTGSFESFDVQKDFSENGFTWFTKNLVLCCGDSTESNAMTIGWGSIGNYLGHNRPTITVYVAPSRYTHDFMERHTRFTVMEFDDPCIWQYLGKYSGRDGDKAAALGLTLAYTANGAPYSRRPAQWWNARR